MSPKQFNNTSYTNRDGKVIPAKASIEYRRKTDSGRLITTDNPALARDTVITVTPDAPYATHKEFIYLDLIHIQNVLADLENGCLLMILGIGCLTVEKCITILEINLVTGINLKE